MGKRKRSGEGNEKTSADLDSDSYPPSENMPRSSGAKASCKEKSSSFADFGEVKPSLSGTVGADASMRPVNAQSSLAQYQSRRPRHYYRHQYMRRNSGKRASAPSASHGKSSLCNERLSLRLPGHKEVTLKKPDRIESGLFGLDPSKAVCSLCQKPLRRRKPYTMGDSLSGGEYVTVAVLVCGHVFHANCLEVRIDDQENRHDPPCPICSPDAWILG